MAALLPTEKTTRALAPQRYKDLTKVIAYAGVPTEAAGYFAALITELEVRVTELEARAGCGQ